MTRMPYAHWLEMDHNHLLAGASLVTLVMDSHAQQVIDSLNNLLFLRIVLLYLICVPTFLVHLATHIPLGKRLCPLKTCCCLKVLCVLFSIRQCGNFPHHFKLSMSMSVGRFSSTGAAIVFFSREWPKWFLHRGPAVVTFHFTNSKQR